MSKITFKPAGQTNTHYVYKDGKMVGEFRFYREITRNAVVRSGRFYDFESNGEYDLSTIAYFKDVKRIITAHYQSNAQRLRPDAYRFGQTLFRVGDTVKLNPRTGSKDRKPAKIEALYSDIAGGVRLDEKRGDFVSWNVCDLDKVEAQQAAA